MKHQPSNFATYHDADGDPVFETYFVRANWQKGLALYAYRNWQAREDALDIAARSHVDCQAISHREAFLAIRNGAPAWLHDLTAADIQSFRPLSIRFPARVA